MMGTSSTKWVEIFLNAGVTERQLLDPEYLFSQFGDGFGCKACGRVIYAITTDKHLKQHRNEVAQYKNKRSRETAEARKAALVEARKERGKNSFDKTPKTPLRASTSDKLRVPEEGCYPIPCSKCGKGIERTGKRGRPPTKHDKCK